MIERYLECFHALDKLSSFVGVGFSDSTPSHKVLHRPHNVFSVLSWRGVALNDAGEPVANDKNLLDRVIAQLGRLVCILIRILVSQGMENPKKIFCRWNLPIFIV